MIEVGDIAFSYPKELGFYSRAVRFFTNSHWSHCFYIAPEYCGELMVIETDLKVQAVPFEKEYLEKKNDIFKLYRPVKAIRIQKEKSAMLTFRLAAGETYGFLSIPWFALRSLIRWIFNRRLTRNFSTSGMICSELLLIYIMGLKGEYAEAFKHLTENETSPQDIYDVVISRPDLFQAISLLAK